MNGKFGSDKGKGEFTCLKNNGSSVIDYVIVSSMLMPDVNDFKVCDFDPCLSDVHILLGVVLEFTDDKCDVYQRESPYSDDSIGGNNLHVPTSGTIQTRVSWDSCKKDEYCHNFTEAKVDMVLMVIDDANNLGIVDQVVNLPKCV